MNIKNNIIRLLNKFNDLRTNMLGGDVIEVTPEVNEANEFITSIIKLSNDFKLNCAWKCLGEDINVEKSINELYAYVSDADRAFFISNEFRKIILSNSILASSLIAFIIGKIIRQDRKCTHEEAILLNALGNMTDYDFKNFIVMMDSMTKKLGCYEVVEPSNFNIENQDSYYYTLYLCSNMGIFLIKSDIHDEESESLCLGTHYVVGDVAYTLMRYIKEVKQLLRYQE